jgi:hypothetical protein
MKDGMNDMVTSVQSCGMIQILEWQVPVMPVSIKKRTAHTIVGTWQKAGYSYNYVGG